MHVYRQSRYKHYKKMGIGTGCFALTCTFAKLLIFYGKQGSCLAFAVFCFELVGDKWLHMKGGVNVVFWSN